MFITKNQRVYTAGEECVLWWRRTCLAQGMNEFGAGDKRIYRLGKKSKCLFVTLCLLYCMNVIWVAGVSQLHAVLGPKWPGQGEFEHTLYLINQGDNRQKSNYSYTKKKQCMKNDIRSSCSPARTLNTYHKLSQSTVVLHKYREDGAGSKWLPLHEV